MITNEDIKWIITRVNTKLVSRMTNLCNVNKILCNATAAAVWKEDIGLQNTMNRIIQNI